MVSDWTSAMLEMTGRRERMLGEAAAAGTAVTSLPGHAAWTRRAEGAVKESAELLADEDRYGVHLDRIAGARAQLGEPLGELGRALVFDGTAASLQSEWRARERGEGDTPLEDFAARIAALAREAAPGEMPPDLSRAVDEIAERQREAEERRRKEDERNLAEQKARDAHSALEALARERTQLLHAAALEPVAKRADWQDWRDRAEPAMAAAAKVAEDAALGEEAREALAALAEELARGLAVDREAAELRQHAEAQHGGKGVDDLRLIAPVADATCQHVSQAQAALRLAQQDEPAVRRDQTAIEGGAHLLAAHRWKIEGEQGIVGHGGRGAFVAWEEGRFDNEFLLHGNGLRHVRHPKIRHAVNNPG